MKAELKVLLLSELAWGCVQYAAACMLVRWMQFLTGSNQLLSEASSKRDLGTPSR
jgi:hypothetical protein